MKLRVLGAVCATAFFVPIFPAAGQESPALPKVLRIFREEIKQGKSMAHEKSEAAFIKAAGRYKYPIYSIGCDMLAGPSEAWFFEGHESFKSIGDVEGMIDKNPSMRAEFGILDAADGEVRTSSTTMVAVLRDDLSYRASQFAQDLPKTRYFSLSIVRIRPYSDMRLAELGKQAIAASEKANSEEPVATYQVVAGGPAGMYMLFTPMKSLGTMDDAPARTKAMIAAMGMDKGMAFYKSAGEIITGSQSLLLAINPKISYVSKEFAAQDSDFWTPKAAVAKPAAAKPAEKSGAGR